MNSTNSKEIRIGVYVCRCGQNIDGTVDCRDVAEYASGLADVVISREIPYLCSEPGQFQIIHDIKESGINRIVIGSCTPRLHESTFRQCLEHAGLSPYLMEIANLREQCSWVHSGEREKATEKAKDLIRSAVDRSRLLTSLQDTELPVARTSLIIGGGVAGIQAALDLADAGYRVILVEKEPSIGGIMARLDKTYPTMESSICILGPKMTDAGRHPNITLLTMSEVKEITGYVGNFHVRIRKKARYVTNECNACGECSEACPVLIPDDYNLGLSTRKAIYRQFPQAVPSAYVVDINHCLIMCTKCKEKCARNCIDFDMNDEDLEFNVGTIILATGVDMYDPSSLDEYGYTHYENVLTSMEIERLTNPGGPTGGEVIRITDRKVPKSVSFIQCVGSRSQHRGHPYCSNICCMTTIKSSIMLKEKYPEMEVKVFYLDIRAFGKGFEDLFRRSKALGVRYIRGLPGLIKEDSETRDLTLTVENTSTNKLETHLSEMVVLAVGLKSPEDMKVIQEMLALQKSSDGFYLEAHPKLLPVDSATKGIFYCGCAEGPKDIKESVTQASAAAARAMRIMNPGSIKIESIYARVDEQKCTMCGLCAKACPFNAITVNRRKKTPARVNAAACAGCGNCAAECPENVITMNHFTDAQILAQIDAVLEDKPQDRVLVFACNWCSYAGADFAGVSGLQYPSGARIIRTMCSARVAENFVWHAFKKGAPVVLVSGCHPGDCHYIDANHWTESRVKKMHKRMETLGINKDRLQLEWISAAEGARFQKIMLRMEELRQEVTEEEIKKTQQKLAENKPAKKAVKKGK